MINISFWDDLSRKGKILRELNFYLKLIILNKKIQNVGPRNDWGTRNSTKRHNLVKDTNYFS